MPTSWKSQAAQKMKTSDETDMSAVEEDAKSNPIPKVNNENVMEDIKCVMEFINRLKLTDKEEFSQQTRSKMQEMEACMQTYLGAEKSASMKDEAKQYERASMKSGQIHPDSDVGKASSDTDSSSKSQYDADSETTDSTYKTGARPKRSDLMRLVDVMGNFGNRKIPEMEKFDENSGQELKKYLSEFENYCKENLNGGKLGWLAELKKNLDGKTLEAFNMLRTGDDSYSVVKVKLLEWFEDSKETRKLRRIRQFEKIKYMKGEEMFLYCCRLEGAFKLAYPKQRVSKSTVLQQKFRTTVPREVSAMLRTHKIIMKASNKAMSWSDVKKCAKNYDEELVELREEKASHKDSSDDEIVIDLERDFQSNQATAVRQRDRYINSGFPQSSPFTNRTVRFARNDYETRDRRMDNFRSRYGRQPNGNQMRNRQHSSQIICDYCGQQGHVKKFCKQGQNCYNCNGRGHFARDCPSSKIVSRRDRSAGPFSRNSQNRRTSPRHEYENSLGTPDTRRVHNERSQIQDYALRAPAQAEENAVEQDVVGDSERCEGAAAGRHQYINQDNYESSGATANYPEESHYVQHDIRDNRDRSHRQDTLNW